MYCDTRTDVYIHSQSIHRKKVYNYEGTDEDTIFIRKFWDCSHMVIGALGGVGTYDFGT